MQRDTVASGVCFDRLPQGDEVRGDKRAPFVQTGCRDSPGEHESLAQSELQSERTAPHVTSVIIHQPW